MKKHCYKFPDHDHQTYQSKKFQDLPEPRPRHFSGAISHHLIAVGRNKGLSIILATQNMDSFKSEPFDFYANAQYPLIMKQQSINDGVIRDLFGVSGQEFNEIKQAIAGLQLGELIIKNPTAITLGMGKKYKKIRVRHLI